MLGKSGGGQKSSKYFASVQCRHVMLRSIVWKCFENYTFDGKVTNRPVCWLCTRQLSYSITTSNLWTQLLACHPSEAAEAPQMSGASVPHWPCRIAHYSANSASAGTLLEARKSTLANKIARFICKHMRPIGIVSGSQDWTVPQCLTWYNCWHHTVKQRLYWQRSGNLVILN